MGVWAQGDTSAVVDSENQPEMDSEDLISGSVSAEYELIPFVQFDGLQGKQVYDTQRMARSASPAYANTAYPEPVRDPTSSTATIGSYFFNWNVWTFNPVLSAQQNVQNQAKNIDLILRQSKNSFSALVSNQASMASEINEIIGNVTNLSNWSTNVNNVLDRHQSDISTVNGNITNLSNWSKNVNNVLDQQKADISTANGGITILTNWSKNVNNVLDQQQADISAVNSSLSNWSKNVNNVLDQHKADISKANGAITILTNWSKNVNNVLDQQQADISAVNSSLSNWSKNVNNVLDQHKADISKANGAITILTNWSKNVNNVLDQQQADISAVNSSLSNWSENVNNVLDQHKADISTSNGSITTLVNWSKNVNNVLDQHESDISTVNNRLDTIESFDFASVIDLTILLTAINAVGSKVQELINVFDVTDPQPDSFAFFFQSLIKSQTLAIVDALAMVDESLNDNFVNYFSDSKNGQFWTAYKEFSDFQMAVFFGVFFESLQENWESNWLTVLDVWNTTNSFLDTIAGWLDQIQLGVSESKEILTIITNWLKIIYEKPVPSFNVPVFDYARLERMLKKLEFGEVVNEAGTNIWDFLTSLIDNLGDIITTQLKEFTKVLSEILDFLDGLIDKMIGLIVPKNLDFMRQGFDDVNLKFKAKFGNFLNITSSITQMFQPIEKDFITELSFDFMGVPFVPDVTILATFVPKFRNVIALLMWFNVGWWAFRRFTGTGDVVNDN